MRDSLVAGTCSRRGDRSPPKFRASSSLLSTSRNMPPKVGGGSKQSEESSEARGRRKVVARQLATLVVPTTGRRSTRAGPPLPPVPASTKRARTPSMIKRTEGTSTNRQSSKPVQRTVDPSHLTSSQSPLKKSNKERSGLGTSDSSSRPLLSLKAGSSRTSVPVPKPVAGNRTEVLAPGRVTVTPCRSPRTTTSVIGTATTGSMGGTGGSTARAAAAAAAVSRLPHCDEPFRPSTRQGRQPELKDYERILPRWMYLENGASASWQNREEFDLVWDALPAMAAPSASTSAIRSSSAGNCRGGGRGTVDRGVSCGGSSAVGSRRPVVGSTGVRARGRISPSPARRGGAAGPIPTPAPATAPSAPAGETENGATSFINTPGVTVHNRFPKLGPMAKSDRVIPASRQEPGFVDPVGVARGARRKRSAMVGSAAVRPNGAPVAPPLPPRGGASSLSSGEEVSAATVPMGIPGGVRATGNGVAPTTQANRGEVPYSWPTTIPKGTDYDMDEDDRDFLKVLNHEYAETENGRLEGMELDEASWVMSAEIFEDLIEHLERQEDNARDHTNLMETSERLVIELETSKAKALQVCDEADDMLDPNSQKTSPGKHSNQSAKSPGRRWGDSLNMKVKELEEIARTKKGLLLSEGQSGGACSGGGDGSTSDDDDDDAVIARKSELSAIRRDGPVYLTRDVALHMLRKRLVASQQAAGGGGGIPNLEKPESETANTRLKVTNSRSSMKAGGQKSGGEPSLTPKERASRSKGKGRAKDERRRQAVGNVSNKVTDGGLEKLSDSILVKLYSYWAAKRVAYNGPMLRCLHVHVGAKLWQRVEDPEREMQDVEHSMDPEADDEALDLLEHCRTELEHLRRIADLAKRREKEKSNAFQISSKLVAMAPKMEKLLEQHMEKLRRQAQLAQRPKATRRAPRPQSSRNSPPPTRGRLANPRASGMTGGVAGGTAVVGARATGTGGDAAGVRTNSGGSAISGGGRAISARAAAQAARLAVKNIASKEVESQNDTSRSSNRVDCGAEGARASGGSNSESRGNCENPNYDSRNRDDARRKINKRPSQTEMSSRGGKRNRRAGSGSIPSVAAAAASSATLPDDYFWKRLEGLQRGRPSNSVMAEEHGARGGGYDAGSRPGNESVTATAKQDGAFGANSKSTVVTGEFLTAQGYAAHPKSKPPRVGLFSYNGLASDGVRHAALLGASITYDGTFTGGVDPAFARDAITCESGESTRLAASSCEERISEREQRRLARQCNAPGQPEPSTSHRRHRHHPVAAAESAPAPVQRAAGRGSTSSTRSRGSADANVIRDETTTVKQTQQQSQRSNPATAAATDITSSATSRRSRRAAVDGANAPADDNHVGATARILEKNRSGTSVSQHQSIVVNDDDRSTTQRMLRANARGSREHSRGGSSCRGRVGGGRRLVVEAMVQ